MLIWKTLWSWRNKFAENILAILGSLCIDAIIMWAGSPVLRVLAAAAACSGLWISLLLFSFLIIVLLVLDFVLQVYSITMNPLHVFFPLGIQIILFFFSCQIVFSVY